MTDDVVKPARGMGLELREVRKQKNRHRLAYLLLDVFLGGFIVGIVLMVTLGRPPSESESVGSGGEAFLMIEFWWDQPELIFSPQLSLDGAPVSPFGLASPWNSVGSPDPGSPWVPHDARNASLTVGGPFLKVAMDGFDPAGLSGFFEAGGESSSRYGYVWLSQPCIGRWDVGLRVVEQTVNMKEDEEVLVRYQVRWSGYSEDQEEASSAERRFERQSATEASQNSMQALGTLRLGAGMSDRIKINLPDFESEPFAHCTDT